MRMVGVGDGDGSTAGVTRIAGEDAAVGVGEGEGGGSGCASDTPDAINAFAKKRSGANSFVA